MMSAKPGSFPEHQSHYRKSAKRSP